MIWTDRIRQVKIFLVLAALVIAGASLIVSNALISDLKKEEQVKMETWAEAMRALIRADGNADLGLVLKVINSNHAIPVVVLDAKGNIMESRNMEQPTDDKSARRLHDEAKQMIKAGRFMKMWLTDEPTTGSEAYITICYGESLMLKRLAAYPYIQLGVVGLFIALAVYALLSSKRAEQNKVWVGLSRETAHQLGTPTSSLMAWTEVLRENYPDDPLLDDLSNDVRRLRLIVERFSKIGSAPELSEEDLCQVIGRAVEYMSRRTSDKVRLVTSYPSETVRVRLNAPLFEWVIENLCKNAIDAMSGEGSISIYVYRAGRRLNIEVSDTGKGIAKQHLRTVFRPGFTTKKRGWGLGLSLARRIVEQYHRGRIYVRSSEIGKGTTFCIELPLA